MSSEIYYNRGYIRVGTRYIPVVNHGSTNCYQFDRLGREIPERHWSVLRHPSQKGMLFTEGEMKQIAERYEKISAESQGGIRKSRNKAFEKSEFGRWILNGTKSACTLEEYRQYGNSVVIIDYDDNYRRYPVRSTTELLDKIKELAEKSIDVSFGDDRQLSRPPQRRQGKPFDFGSVSEFFVLYTDRGYFAKRSNRRAWFIQKTNPALDGVRKFRTARAAEKYIADNRDVFLKFPARIECIKPGGAKT